MNTVGLASKIEINLLAGFGQFVQGKGDVRAYGCADEIDFVLEKEFLGLSDRHIRPVLVVLENDLDFLAQNTSLSVNLLQHDFPGFLGIIAPLLHEAGHGLYPSDLDCVLGQG